MIVGFTGTRKGCTIEQKKAIKRLLLRYKPGLVVHGGCSGADIDFDMIAWVLGIRRRCYPAATPGIYRGTPIKAYDEKYPVKDPLERNHDIVEAADVMLACPSGNAEILRSGTWATIRFARKFPGKALHIIYPGGDTENLESTP